MKKLLSIIVTLVISVTMMMAQTKTVSGSVISAEDGEPIIGASVVATGTTAGTVTDMNGNFSFNAPASAKTLTVSFVGMISQVVNISGKRITVTLSANNEVLDEVMVVAYGTAKKSSFSGSASTVKSDNLEKLQVSDVSKALEGAVAGVQIASSSGTPGSSASIRIRGIGSINSSQEPLIVLDGVAYEGSLNSIPTQDIESMTILKDAAANSMYGARGSNGVIIITTKTAKGGKAKINFEARYGMNSRGVSAYDIITDPGEYYEMFYEAYRNQLTGQMGYVGASNYAANNLIGKLKYNVYKGVADNAIIDPTTGKLTSAAKGASLKWTDDWSKDPFNSNANRQEYNVNISGGNDNTQAYASFSYLTEDGYVAGSGFDRISTRVKVDQRISKYIKAGANLAYSNTKKDVFGDTSSNYSNIFMFSQMIAPIYPIYLYDTDGNLMLDENGNKRFDWGTEYIRPYASEQNPMAQAIDCENSATTDNISGRGYVDVTLGDFKLTANIAYDTYSTRETEFTTANGGDAASVGGRGYKYSYRNGVLNANQLINWGHDYNGHNVSVLLGHETNSSRYEYMYGHMTNFVSQDNHDFAGATVYQGLSSYTSEHAIESFFGKLDYNYKEKYFFTSSLRRDASSRFYKDNRWGTFWALGASWRVTKEKFMNGVEWMNDLKIKASYGTQGNEAVGLAKAYTDMYTVERVNGDAAFTKYLRGNKDLTWEKSRNFNIGIESTMLDSRLRFNADFFIKETIDMIYASPIPSSEGSPNYIYKNEMDMKNTGFEFEVSADVFKSKNWNWNIALNGTTYKNELTRLPESKQTEEFKDGYQAGSYWRKLGGSLYDWYTYEYAGVDKTTGAPQFRKYEKDDNGDPVYDANGEEKFTLVANYSEATLRQTGKSAIPDFVGGLSTNLSAHGFDLSVSTAFQFGGWIQDSFYQQLMTCGKTGQNFHRDMFNRWTPTHTETDIPALCLDTQSSHSLYGDYFLTTASYFSLRNVTFGYTVPSKLLRRAKIERLRVYAAGDNLWLLSARKGLDPRQSFSGSTGYVYSALRTVSFGINIGF